MTPMTDRRWIEELEKIVQELASSRQVLTQLGNHLQRARLALAELQATRSGESGGGDPQGASRGAGQDLGLPQHSLG